MSASSKFVAGVQRSSHLFAAASVVLLLLCCSAHADDITHQVFASYNKFMPAAFGDFNSDKHTDIFAIEQDKNSGTCFVKVLLSYVDPPLLRPDGPNCTCPGGNIKSVVPGDFDGDGSLDLLLLSVRPDGLYDVYIAWGNLKILICPTEKILTVRGQPLMMDYNGDMIADLFGEDEDNTRSFFLFSTKRGPPDQITVISETPLKPLRIPSSHGFVDLDGNLAADLFVTADGQFEIWENTLSGFFLSETIPIPDWATVVGQTAFMDIALTGTNVPITVLCRKEDCTDGQIYVWTKSLKSGMKEFVPVGFSLVEKTVSWSYPSNSHPVYPYTDTISLRVADHDLDGYPDLLLTLIDSSNKPQVVLAFNRPCSGAGCSDHERQFIAAWDILSAYPDSVLATFFDVFEDGRVDTLILHKDKDDPEQYVMSANTDTQQYDAMFLKVLVPSGRCYSECKNKNVPYGTSPAGPTFRYSITTGDTKGLQVSLATQLSQSSHMALQLPFILFGLGRNWNFVETLEVGLPIKDTPTSNYGFYNKTSLTVSTQSDRFFTSVSASTFPSVRNFTQIIPNSQVIVIPYPMDKPLNWVTKLYITPSKALKMTAAALLAVCLLVAVVIAVLHYREKQEDKKEKLQQAQTFHFDAM
uniref:T-cell immunomodulatory protein n=1 Tax=Hirondellea gigas TaxID=1518452 RepID=A0A6A7G0S0_9CRUS